jgi:CRISPR-associated protein Cmr3
VPTSQPRNGKQYKEPTGLWITVEGYNTILAGQFPTSHVIARSSDLWCAEPRVGLACDHESRTAQEGKLYSPQYVRLKEGVSLVTGMEGVPENWTLPSLLTFGGEGRMAYCNHSNDPLPLPVAPTDAIRQSSKFTVTLLTPLHLSEEQNCHKHPLPGEEFPGLSGSRIVSACVGKPIQIGGWNSLDRKPLPLRAYLPAGSTWFCEASQKTISGILNMHGQYVGERTQYGLGQIALGVWPPKNGDTQ